MLRAGSRAGHVITISVICNFISYFVFYRIYIQFSNVVTGHITRPSGCMRPVRYELITSALRPLCALLVAFRLGISYLPIFFVTTVNTVIFEMRA